MVPVGSSAKELTRKSPGTSARGTFPGFVYQLGNLIASVNATLQADIAARYDKNYGLYFRAWDRLMGTDVMPEETPDLSPAARPAR